jgi:hypothetical protein
MRLADGRGHMGPVGWPELVVLLVVIGIVAAVMWLIRSLRR